MNSQTSLYICLSPLQHPSFETQALYPRHDPLTPPFPLLTHWPLRWPLPHLSAVHFLPLLIRCTCRKCGHHV